ncbi:MAG: ATP-binding cassette domain-containing protein, partial [Erysipelotrichaceae bacterium]
MLELKKIKKTYHVHDVETKALDGISVAFRDQEFVSILGSSGSGKTTCLNIIGGLDRYDAGELVIKGKTTKDFTDKDWDAYRNNSIGFVFQSYNLITHLSIVANVEMGMTLSGVSKKEKRQRALEVLERVGLQDHLHKKPNQLSGGQMQRVAIARALANDPEILLCDEPTGALDTHTGETIMDLIKEVAADKLVIMVTHNPEIAERYSNRIVRFQDGLIISDSNPYLATPRPDRFSLKKTSMGFQTALGLSFRNIQTKKGRTFLTAFASSIGIIGIAVILSLSTGFQTQIDSFQREALSEFPITITQQTMLVDETTLSDMQEQFGNLADKEYADTDRVTLYDPADTSFVHYNQISEDFINYIEQLDPSVASSIGYSRLVNMNVLRKVGDSIVPISFGSNGMMTVTAGSMPMTSSSSMLLSSYPTVLDTTQPSYVEQNYDLMEGAYPSAATDLVIVVDSMNRIEVTTAAALGFDTDAIDEIAFTDLIGMEFQLVGNDDYYMETPFGTFAPNPNTSEVYEAENNVTLRVSGVVREKAEVSMGILAPGIAYSDALSQLVIERADTSKIVEAQRGSNTNVMTLDTLTTEQKDGILQYLGGDASPMMVMIYPNNFEEKGELLAYLDAYNESLPREEKVIYTDLADTISSMTGGIMDGITIVLVAFAAISLIVSLIMIGIITYISVLERTKEIGILKALGARKKDISRVFDAETFLLGIFSGVLGITIAYALTIPINSVIYSMTELQNVATLQPVHALTLVTVSTLLTMLGGHIPARMAAKKDAVE